MKGVPQRHAVAAAVPVLVLGLAVFFGAVLGCFLGCRVSGEAAAQVREYLDACICVVRRGEVFSLPSAVLRDCGQWLLVCLLSGTSVVGLIAIPALFVARGALFGFGVGCVLCFVSDGAAALAAVLFVLPAVLWIPGFLLAGCFALGCSWAHAKPEGGDLAPYSSGYRLRGLACSLLLLLLCVILESILLPKLLSAVVLFLD